MGEVDPTHFAGSASEFTAQDAALTADANGDIVGDMILEVTPMAVDPDDALLSYDEYLAQKSRVDDDVNRPTREVTNEGDFKQVKQLVKEEEGLFGEALTAEQTEVAARTGGAKKNKKNKISLDEFVGAGAAAPAASASRGGRGGFEGAARGGRGGFEGAARGGRGGFEGAARGTKENTTETSERGVCIE